MEGIDSLSVWSDRRSRLGLNRTKGRTKMLSGERLTVREGARYWWAFLVSGIVWLLIAWLVLRLNTTSIATVGVLLGVVFLLSGINEVGLASVVPGGWKVWHWILAVIFFLGGVVRLCPAGQHLLRPGLGAGADPGLLRRLRDRPGGGPPGGGPLLVAESDHRDPADLAGVLGVGLGPGVCPGPADLSDLVLGRVPGVVPGLLPDLFGLQCPPRRPGGRRRARRHEPRLATGPSSPTPAS